MKLYFIEEPELEFGGAGRHIDIRHGITAHGPLDGGLPTAPQNIRVGVVGIDQDVERLRAWIDRCRGGIDAKVSKRNTLFVGFPGFGTTGMLSDFVVDERLVEIISARDLREMIEQDDIGFHVGSIERYRQGASDLFEKARADVVLCLLPGEVVRRIDVSSTPDAGPRARRKRSLDDQLVWHDVFKAQALHLAHPVQVVRPALYSDGVSGFTRAGKAVYQKQDEATRAWNFFCALYYKAGGIPWRLARESTDLMTCYMGISFYYDPHVESLRTSIAQVFNERGEGMVVRGSQAVLDEVDNTPHLSPEDAEQLVEKAVEQFRREHRTAPARLVCHKSSYFSEAELQGCAGAVSKLRLDSYDLLSLRPSHTRLYRAHSYPPLRGTALVHAGGCLLYTQGSVDFYRCYPGQYAPRTLDVQLDHKESGEVRLLSELLALTKMNWNSTELINLEPITLSAARSVGAILRHVTDAGSLPHRFSSFM